MTHRLVVVAALNDSSTWHAPTAVTGTMLFIPIGVEVAGSGARAPARLHLLRQRPRRQAARRQFARNGLADPA